MNKKFAPNGDFFSSPKINVMWKTYVPMIIWLITTLQPSASSMALSQRSTKIGPVMTKKMIYGWTAQVGYQGVMSSDRIWLICWLCWYVKLPTHEHSVTGHSKCQLFFNCSNEQKICTKWRFFFQVSKST